MSNVNEVPLLYDHYVVEHVLGSGAMGVVYLARDARLGRLVALKTLHSRRQLTDEPAAASTFERFRREAQLCSALVHPNIVTLYEAGYEGQRFTYLAMEYVEGESLQALLRRGSRLDVGAAAKIVYDILQGLSYAHSHGVVHRDIKPANILVSAFGQAKIADFGIATSVRASSSELTEKGQLLGTPHYMAPEHIAGRTLDHRADLFSVGVLFYEMLAGRKPFDGTGLTDVLFDVVHRTETPLCVAVPELPAWCGEFSARLLAKAPDGRYSSASEAAEALRRFVGDGRALGTLGSLPIQLSVERPRSPDDTPTTPIRSDELKREFAALKRQVPRRFAAAAIGASLLATGGLVWVLQRHIDETPRELVTPSQRAEFEKKQSALREASLLYDVGAYEESIRRYDDYLARYPHSPAAREGRTRAAEALRARTTVRSERRTTTHTVAAKSSRPKREQTEPAQEAAPVKPSFWARVKGFFSGKDRS